MGYFKSLEAVQQSTASTNNDKITPKFTMEYTVESLVEKLTNGDTLTDEEIQGIIYRQLDMLLNYDLFFAQSETREVAQKLFTNERFLRALLAAIHNVNLNRHQIVCCNKLAFDYCRLHGVNNQIGELLLQLSYGVNRNMVLGLSGIVGFHHAMYMAMIRNSSFVEAKNVSRINNFLIRNITDCTAQNIVDIYSKMFSRVTVLFVTTMNELPSLSFTKEEKRIYDLISISMVAILDNMTSVEMEKVLVNYGTDHFLNRSDKAVRFSLQNLDGYPRIARVIKKIEEDGIYIP